MTTHDDVERRAEADLAAHRGKVIAVDEFDAYLDDELVTITPDDPVRFVVRDGVIRWPDTQWCDPIWDLDLDDNRDRLVDATPMAASIRLGDLRSFMTYGISHSTSGTTDGPRWVLVDEPALRRAMRWMRRKVTR